MAKDALGHGSDSHASQAARGDRPAAHSTKIQQLNTSMGHGSDIMGQWQTVKVVGPGGDTGRRTMGGNYVQPNARAESIARGMRADARGLYAKTRSSNPNPTRVK